MNARAITLLVCLLPIGPAAWAGVPPPPCQPSSLKGPEVLRTLQSWPGYASLASIPATVEVDPCRQGHPTNETVRAHLKWAPSAALAAKGAVPMRTSVYVAVVSATGQIVDTPDLRKTLAALAAALPAHAQAMAADATVQAWSKAHPVGHANYRAGDQPGAGCALLIPRAKTATGHLLTLQWCPKRGVDRYSIATWDAFPAAHHDSLKAHVAARYPGRDLMTVSFSLGAKRPVWFARGTLQGKTAPSPRETFEAAQNADGAWTRVD